MSQYRNAEASGQRFVTDSSMSPSPIVVPDATAFTVLTSYPRNNFLERLVCHTGGVSLEELELHINGTRRRIMIRRRSEPAKRLA